MSEIVASPKGRSPRESRVEMTEIVLPSDTNVHGTIFGGRVMQWIDIAGAVAARRHARSGVVTASMDELHFHVPISVGSVVVLEARVLAGGQDRHLKSLRGRRQIRGRLVGRPRSRHEEQPVQIEDLTDLVGDEQMAEVDRVERAAEQPDPRHGSTTRGYARRPRRRTSSWSAPALPPAPARGAWRSRPPSPHPCRTVRRPRGAWTR